MTRKQMNLAGLACSFAGLTLLSACSTTPYDEDGCRILYQQVYQPPVTPGGAPSYANVPAGRECPDENGDEAAAETEAAGETE